MFGAAPPKIMPEAITEFARSSLYALSKGFPYDTDVSLLEQAANFSGSRLGPVLRSEKLAQAGRGNLGIDILHFQNRLLVRKRTALLNEYHAALALRDQGSSEFRATFFAVGMRGPVFHIFQEFLPSNVEELSADEHARLLLGLSHELTKHIPEAGRFPRLDHAQLKSARFLRLVTKLTNDPAARILKQISGIENRPWRLQHNDLHQDNIRRRGDGTPAAIDLATIAWSIEGSDFFWLAPDGRGEREAARKFEEVTDIASVMLGTAVRPLRQAALLRAALRHRRRAITHRDRRRNQLAASILADAISMQ